MSPGLIGVQVKANETASRWPGGNMLTAAKARNLFLEPLDA